jgi:hypothetical protein
MTTDTAANPPPAPPSEQRLADRPAVSRAKLSKSAIGLAIFGVLAVGGYAAFAYTDYEPGSPDHDEIPASVRSSPGGYRSYHFWHSGYHGGK